MKNKEIYSSALSLLDQRGDDGINEDYEERAPYLIAAFCNEIFEIDALARKLLGLPSRSEICSVWLDLNDDFPLLDRFAAVASKYLAAMLVIDEDGDLSDKLYEMYCDGISMIRSQLPSFIEKTVNKY